MDDRSESNYLSLLTKILFSTTCFFTCCQCTKFSFFVCHLFIGKSTLNGRIREKKARLLNVVLVGFPFFPCFCFVSSRFSFAPSRYLPIFLDTIERWLFVIAALTRADATYGASAAIMRALQLCRHASTHITSKLLACRFVVCLLLFLLTIHQEHTRERHE